MIPIGEDRALQQLVRITREGDGRLRREALGDVRFVPLIGAEGWAAEEAAWDGRPPRAPSPPATLARLVREVAEPLESIDDPDLGSLLERIAHSRLVLIGEATHGTSEFYRLRARITQELVRSAWISHHRRRGGLA